MKIAVLSDIHGNTAAFETVVDHIQRWQPDHVIINGDIVNRGPHSRHCWQVAAQLRAERGWHIVRGNHEDYVLSHAQPTPSAEHLGIQAEINQNSKWTYDQLAGHTAALSELPDAADFIAPDGSELRIRHASMRGNRDGIYPSNDEALIRRQIAPFPAVFVTSHIHMAYTCLVDETLLVNSGSAGHHNAGDTRATYAQIIWTDGAWQAEIVRLPYDMAATERAYYESGFMDETGPTAQLIFYEWKTAVPLLPMWRMKYETAVVSGELDLATSVNDLLQAQGIVSG